MTDEVKTQEDLDEAEAEKLADEWVKAHEGNRYSDENGAFIAGYLAGCARCRSKTDT